MKGQELLSCCRCEATIRGGGTLPTAVLDRLVLAARALQTYFISVLMSRFTTRG